MLQWVVGWGSSEVTKGSLSQRGLGSATFAPKQLQQPPREHGQGQGCVGQLPWGSNTKLDTSYCAILSLGNLSVLVSSSGVDSLGWCLAQSSHH